MSLTNRLRKLRALKKEGQRARERRRKRKMRQMRRDPGRLMDFYSRLGKRFKAPEHFPQIIDVFERIKEGRRIRLETGCDAHDLPERLRPRIVLISAPPQSRKSTTVFGALCWIWADDLEFRVQYNSNSSKQGWKRSKRLRGFARRLGYPIRKDANAAEQWLFAGTENGEGGMQAAGGCTGTTGNPADLSIVDDPHEGRADANSPAKSGAVWEWFFDGVMTRGEEGAWVIVIHTRWGNTDLIGRLKDILEHPEKHPEVDYENLLPIEVIEIKALDENDESTMPKVFSTPILRGRRAVNRIAFEASYQQNPQPLGTRIFEQPTYIDELPSGPYSAGLGVDLAYTAKDRSDPHALCVVRYYPELGIGVIVEALARRAPLLNRYTDRSHEKIEKLGFLSDIRRVQLAHPEAGDPYFYAGNNEEVIVDILDNLEAPVHINARRAQELGDKHARALPWAELWNQGRLVVWRKAKGLDQILDAARIFTGLENHEDAIIDALAPACAAARMPEPGVITGGEKRATANLGTADAPPPRKKRGRHGRRPKTNWDW